MMAKKPVVPGGVGEDVGCAETPQPEARRQGELWDERGRAASGLEDNAGRESRSAQGNAEASAAGKEASPDRTAERGAEPGSEIPAPDELLRVVRYVSALAEEDETRAQESPAAMAEVAPAPAEAQREDVGESRGSPDGSEGAVTGDRPPGQGESIGSSAELRQALRTFRADFGRWVEGERRSRRRWAGVAMAAGFPAALMLGLLVQQQFQVIPLHDPTKGWGGHIWEMYGRTIVDCALEAMRTDAEVNCPLVVRRP